MEYKEHHVNTILAMPFSKINRDRKIPISREAIAENEETPIN